MPKYLIKSTFTAKTPAGSQLMKKGEAICLSSSKAMSLVASGLIVDAHVGLNILDKYEARVKVLMEVLGYSRMDAQTEALQLVTSCLKRHESTKIVTSPSEGFLAEVEEFNLNSTGPNPITKVEAETGVGEWAGYNCNFGMGCSHGCLYCFAKKRALRFKQVPNSEGWQEEHLKDKSTKRCKKYDEPIMSPTSHDITAPYLQAYRCHLYNMLKAGNKVLIVTKPHRESIEAICSEFSFYRDQMLFRFSIGGLNEDVMKHWEPGAPDIAERTECLRVAFELGYATSVSAEPMLAGREDAVKLYHRLSPYITMEIWFGKMKYIGALRHSPDPEVARHARELIALQTDDEIMKLVDALGGLPKVKWKDSVKKVINKPAKMATLKEK